MDHIFSGIIGSLIAILLWEGGGRLKRQLAEQAIRNFWNFLNKRVAIVIPRYRGTSGEFILTNINDVLALHLLTSFFKGRGIDYKIYGDNDNLPNDVDMVLVCGPKTNKQSKQFYDRSNLRYQIVASEENREIFLIHDIENGVEYWSPKDKKKEDIDFGLIGRCTEDNPHRRVFFFWGIHGIGTIAAVQSSIKQDTIKNITQSIGKEDFSVIIQAPFSKDYEIGKVTLITNPSCCYLKQRVAQP
ncbi:hypothetical protein ACFLRT_05785 [Acidobacteriota bacterium]